MMLGCAWDIARNQYQSIPIYNFVLNKKNKLTYKGFLERLTHTAREYPSIKGMWYYSFKMTPNIAIFAILYFFYHLLPAFFVDLFFVLTNNKKRLLKHYKLIWTLNNSLVFFTTSAFKWESKNVKVS